MKEKLTILYNYLKNNDHMQDANRIAKILDEYDKNGDLSNQLNETTLMIRSYFMDFENGIVKIDEKAFSPKYSFEMFRHSSFYKN